MKRLSAIILSAMLLLPATAGAQALKGSYFLDNSTNRNKMNPAFAPRANYVQIPAVGNIGAGVMTNLDIPTFLYPLNGELATFLHPSVSVQQFDKALPNHPHLDAEVSANLINFGFYTKRKSFWTFDLSVNAGVDVDLPRDLFMFIKKGAGTNGESFNIANMNAYATASVNAALGYSTNVGKGFRVGAKVRFIAPVAYAALNLENVRLTTGADKWVAQTEGYAYTAMQGLNVYTPEGETMPTAEFDVDRFLQNKVLAGAGLSVDLGVEWKLDRGSIFDGLSVSAAVTDLGMIAYKQDAICAYDTRGELVWDGFQDVNMDYDFEAALDEFMAEAEGMLNINQKETKDKLTRSTMPRVYAGVEVPFLWRRMSVGLLYSGRFSHSYYRQELTASYNLKPLKWLALGVNYSFLNTQKTFGWLLELTPKAGVNFYIGGDYLPFEWTPAPILDDALTMPEYFVKKGHVHPYLPMSYRFNLQFGLSLALGSKHGR